MEDKYSMKRLYGLVYPQEIKIHRGVLNEMKSAKMNTSKNKQTNKLTHQA